MFMLLVGYILFFAASIALGADPAAPQTLFGGAPGPDNPLCTIIENAGITWPIFGQIFGILTGAALFLRPFSNLMLKAGLTLSAMPSAPMQAAGKIIWMLGTMASIPAAGTPTVMKQVYAGTVTPPVKAPITNPPPEAKS